jgi:hypothetical protein
MDDVSSSLVQEYSLKYLCKWIKDVTCIDIARRTLRFNTTRRATIEILRLENK